MESENMEKGGTTVEWEKLNIQCKKGLIDIAM